MGGILIAKREIPVSESKIMEEKRRKLMLIYSENISKYSDGEQEG